MGRADRLHPLMLGLLTAAAAAQGFHQRLAIDYARTAADNAATALDRRLAAGELELPAAGPSGRLGAVLRALAVPESSQMLVFSKTSLQRHRISPASPRALFFSADAYVGWVPGAAQLEVAVGDARLGLVFYTVTQDPAQPARFVRDDSCLSCHASERTDDEPGLVLRSVFPDADGHPITAAGEVDVTLRTALRDRWGGWLVTGVAGQHRGNGFASRDERGRYAVAAREAVDLSTFADWFDAAPYPVPHSDIAALLAFEQQATLHNLLIRSSLQLRCLLDNDRAVNGLLGEHGLREQTARVADRLAEAITGALLFADEAALGGQVGAAQPAFARDFVAALPVDADGVRLGSFDLRQRLFTLPLSPFVHAPAFAQLPAPLRDRVLARLRRALREGDLPAGCFLTAAQRRALDRHLQQTLAGY